ncbi:MAG: hypothetical protein EP344_18185 [Bacteroidetes bacterium]|nr:MAG: hypothetical protein EP344_18185 [Bacteroidota bacterium]
MDRNDEGKGRSLYSNKLFQTLRCLDTVVHKRLIRYLQSPYFNHSKTLPRLCSLLINRIDKGADGFDRQQVWKKMFGNVPYDDVNFRKYCSDLLKQVERFLALETTLNDPVRHNMDLLQYVVRNKVEPLYNTALRQVRTALDQMPYRSLDYFRFGYEVERQYYTLMDFDVKLNARANIEEISTNLDLFYWIEKIKLYSSVLSQKRTGNFTYDLNFNDELLEFLKGFPIEEVPELAIYYYSFLTLLDEENSAHYYNLKRMLDQFGAVMPQKDAIELYDSALHYCTGKVNKGDRVFLQEYFDLFEDGIRKSVFVVNDELATWRFNNAVGAALQLGKLDWAEQFIEQYKNNLPIETRQNTYTFNLARVYRYQNKFDKVLSLLRDVEYEDIGYNLIAKAILTITYYELEEYDALDPFMESFRVFLNRQKNIPLQRRKGYLNLIKSVRRLTRLVPGDKAALEKLRSDILREKGNTVNQEWLLEKIAELT